MKHSHFTNNSALCLKASPWIVRLLLLHLALLLSLPSIIAPNLLLSICFYIAGLISGNESSATSIAHAFGFLTHDSFTRMLNQRWWTRHLMIVAAVRLVNLLSITGQGWLIIDDVFIPKPYAAVIAFCAWDFDHSTRRNCFGLRLVFLVWCNGKLTIPIGFLVWQKNPTSKPSRKKKSCTCRQRPKKRGRKKKPGPKKRKGVGRNESACKKNPTSKASTGRRKAVRARTASGAHYRSKNELARILVWEAVRASVKADYVLFDNWYASYENVRLFRRLGLQWVTRLKRNMKVKYEGRTITVGEVAERVIKANYHYYRQLGARARSFEIEVYGRPAKLTVIKNDTHKEKSRTKYLATSVVTLTNREHIQWYRRRWPIEVFFRDCKQLLGLGKSQARKGEAVLTHIMLVAVAYVVLQLLRKESSKPKVSIKGSRDAVRMLHLRKTTEATMSLVRIGAIGEIEEVEPEEVWEGVRTRVYGIELPETLEFP